MNVHCGRRLLTERRQKSTSHDSNVVRIDRGIEWFVALVVMLSIGLDPSVVIWHVTASAVPPEFRTVSISASAAALFILVVYGWWPRPGASTDEPNVAARAIAWGGSVLVGCLGLSALAAGIPRPSLVRSGEVVLGLLACLTLAHRRSLADRVLVCGAGLILLQLPQVIVQEVRQSSISLGSLIPGWSPVTSARMPGAFVVLGPGDLRWQRGMGSFLHPNLFGGFLALALIFSLPWLARCGRYGATLWPVWAIAWVELILTFSRAALAATAVGCLLWGIAHYRHAVSHRQLAVLASVPVAALSGLAMVIGDVLFLRLDPAGTLHSVSATDRWRLLMIGARVVAAHPFLGVGPGNFTVAAARLSLHAIGVQPVHMVPLLVAAEAGVVAGLAWLALVLGGPIVELSAGGTSGRAWCERLAVPVVILILASLDHYFWTFSSGQALFWVTLGIWASQSRLVPHPDWSDAPEPGIADVIMRENGSSKPAAALSTDACAQTTLDSRGR
jgi:hypothetical protein